jgi:hypothetical protein
MVAKRIRENNIEVRRPTFSCAITKIGTVGRFDSHQNSLLHYLRNTLKAVAAGHMAKAWVNLALASDVTWHVRIWKQENKRNRMKAQRTISSIHSVL